MKILFMGTVLVAVGSVFFYAGWTQSLILMSIGIAALLAGIVALCHYGLRTRQNEAK